jgi:PAS domain S-box-containing protein
MLQKTPPDTAAQTRAPKSSPARLAGQIGLLGFALLLAVSLFFAWNERRRLFEDARADVAAADFALADHARRLIEVTDVVLSGAAGLVEERPWAEIAGDRVLQRQLETLAGSTAYVEDVWLNDETGALRLTSFAFPAPASNASDRDVFKGAREAAGALVVGERITGKVTGRPTFMIARRLEDGFGAFRGMASVTVSLDTFNAYWGQVRLPLDARVRLVRASPLDTLAQHPPPAEGEGFAPLNVEAFRQAVATLPEGGIFDSAEVSNGEARIVAYRRVGDLPLYVTVGVSRAAVEAQWRDWLLGYAPLALASFGALGAFTLAAFRQAQRDAETTRSLESARARLWAANQQLEERVAERTRELSEETSRLDTLNRLGLALSSELDPDRLAQALIDAATRLTGAAYGAFFERVAPGRDGNEEEAWRLSALAGAPAEAFTRFGLPRATDLFGPTFRAEGVVRADDVLSDPRYGSMGGMPRGHLPVRSYLAVPVRTRGGETLGALLFGHPEPGRFGERQERLIEGFSGQAAIAFDNARLFASVQEEVAERRRAEEVLATERAQAAEVAAVRTAILGQLGEGVIVADASGRITFVNEAATRLHGVARLDVAPEDYAQTYHIFTEDGRPYPSEELPLARAVIKGETVTEARWRIRRPDGRDVLASGNARPVVAPDGTRIGSVLTMRDDTSRDRVERMQRRLNEALSTHAAELKESNDEIQRYAYIVSHDLRAPLVNVMGFTSELEALGPEFLEAGALAPDDPRRKQAEADFNEALGFIKAAIGKMDRLINAILKLSREGRRTFRPEPLDMPALMQGLADAQRHQADAKGAVVEVAPDMPAIAADRLAMEQIFGNLLDNALKYLDPSRPGRIEIAGQAAPLGRVRFFVKDNGRGIAPQDHDRVFELFRRAGTQDVAGEGIGLAHVKALVRSLGGAISVASELGVGTTFTVTLPAAPPAAPGRSATDAEEE